jgi:hypothetical protein
LTASAAPSMRDLVMETKVGSGETAVVRLRARARTYHRTVATPNLILPDDAIAAVRPPIAQDARAREAIFTALDSCGARFPPVRIPRRPRR